MGKRTATGVISSAAKESLSIAVDVGRSSVKVACDGDTMTFPFLLSNKKAATADYYVSNGQVRKWAVVDGDELLFGEDAMLLGDTIIQHTEGEAFRAAAVKTTIFAIAYAMVTLDVYRPNVNLAINLTFDNHYQKADYAKNLKGQHTVKFVHESDEVTFTIGSVFVLYQGFSGFLSVATDENFKVRKEYLDSEGVVIDIGRQTVDFLYIGNMVVKAGSSKDFGTFKVYEKVTDLLKRKHSIVKEAFEIEDHVTKGRHITQSDGTKVQLMPLIKEAVEFYFDDLTVQFSSFLSKKTPDYMILLGGGAMIYGPSFRERFKLVQVPQDPQLANALGMLRFLSQAAIKS